MNKNNLPRKSTNQKKISKTSLVGRRIKGEIKEVMSCPITFTAIGMGVLLLANQSYKSALESKSHHELTPDESLQMVIGGEKLDELELKTERDIYNSALEFFKNNGLELKEAEEFAQGLIIEIEKSGLLKNVLPKNKPGWLSAIFALIYIYLYTKTIRKIKNDHTTVSTLSFGGFSALNWGFALSNGILDPGSLGYLSAGVMGAITVIVNEKEKKKGDFNVQKILMDFVVGEKNPVVIYKSQHEGDEYVFDKPVFWNPTMEKLTGYTFSEVKHLSQEEIMELLYGHDEKMLKKVQEHLSGLSISGIGYKNKVFTLKNKDGDLIDVSWHTENVSGGGRISFGSIDNAEIQKTLREDDKFDCLNSRALIQDAQELIVQFRGHAEIDNKPLGSFAYCDIDQFKKINDSYGHFIGDIVLKEFIEFFKGEFRRKDDRLYRRGGDEFVAVFRNTTKDKIQDRIQEIQNVLSRRNIVITFTNGEVNIEHLLSDTNSEAVITHLNNSEENKEIGELLIGGNKLTREEIFEALNTKTLVLPPIVTSWGLTDLIYSKLIPSDPQEFKSYIEKVLQEADSAMYASKKSSGTGKVNII